MDTKVIKLTDDEIIEALDSIYGDAWRVGFAREEILDNGDRVIARAQLRKIAEWGDEICAEHKWNIDAIRRQCPKCWQELRKE